MAVGALHLADNEVSKITMDDKIGPNTVTLSPSLSLRVNSANGEGSVAMGVEMLRCAQHDSAVTHTDGRIILLIYIIGGGRDKSGPYVALPD